jgi:hypothetical protein
MLARRVSTRAVALHEYPVPPVTRRGKGPEKWRQYQRPEAAPARPDAEGVGRQYQMGFENYPPGPMDHKRIEDIPEYHKAQDYSSQPNSSVPADAVRCNRKHPVMRTRCVREAGHPMGTCWDINIVGWPTQADMGFLRNPEASEELGSRRDRRNAGRLRVVKRRAK